MPAPIAEPSSTPHNAWTAERQVRLHSGNQVRNAECGVRNKKNIGCELATGLGCSGGVDGTYGDGRQLAGFLHQRGKFCGFDFSRLRQQLHPVAGFIGFSSTVPIFEMKSAGDLLRLAAR